MRITVHYLGLDVAMQRLMILLQPICFNIMYWVPDAAMALRVMTHMTSPIS